MFSITSIYNVVRTSTDNAVCAPINAVITYEVIRGSYANSAAMAVKSN